MGKAARAFVLLYGAALLVPMIWMVLGSFRPAHGMIVMPPRWDLGLTLENYRSALSVQLGRWILNSIILSTGVTGLSLTMALAGGYASAKLAPYGGNAYLTGVVLSMLIPGIVTLVGSVQVARFLGLYNTRAGMIIPQAGAGATLLFFRAFFRRTPDSFREAAIVEGASEARALMIQTPLARSMIAVFGFTTFIGSWLSWLWPLVVSNRSDLYTHPIGMWILAATTVRGGPGGIVDYGKQMAAAACGAAVLVVVFCLGQKYITRGVLGDGDG